MAIAFTRPAVARLVPPSVGRGPISVHVAASIAAAARLFIQNATAKGLPLQPGQCIRPCNLPDRVAACARRNGWQRVGALVIEPGVARCGIIVLGAFPYLC